MSAPRLLLCAPASGGGKTTLTCALLQALVNRGANPVAFKCGPDYIDPMFHSEIIGAKSRNLDLFFLGADTTRYLLEENSRDSGLALIEGVMGYYDGIGLSADASAYDLARATRTPAVLVMDGRGRALTAAAVVRGMKDFRPDSGIAGVILNRVSPMLYPRLREAIERETGVKVYGFLPNRPDCALESRHLGLVTAAEVAGLKEKLSALAAQAEETVDIDGLLALAASAPELAAKPMIWGTNPWPCRSRWRGGPASPWPGTRPSASTTPTAWPCWNGWGRSWWSSPPWPTGACRRGPAASTWGAATRSCTPKRWRTTAPCGRKCAPPCWAACPPWPSAAGSST